MSTFLHNWLTKTLHLDETGQFNESDEEFTKLAKYNAQGLEKGKGRFNKLAAFGTIDLQKYIGEKEGEDFNFEAELQALLKSGVSPNFGIIYFHRLNENLEKSKLKNYISSFVSINSDTALATFDPSTHVVGLRDLRPGDTVDDIAQSIKHELRHSVDKGRPHRKSYISDLILDMAADFFEKNKDVLVDPETKQLKYDRDELIFNMMNDYLSSKLKDKFEPLPPDAKAMEISKYIDKYVKTPDQVYEVFQRLANGEDAKSVISYYNVNHPQEYSTLLSDINDFFSPAAIKKFAERYSFLDKQSIIKALKFALQDPMSLNAANVLKEISWQGQYLIEKTLRHAENEQLRRNVFKIIYDNFQKFVDEFTKEEIPAPDRFKEAKKRYNAPRTGKKKKRWSVKHKRGIDCNNPKGFSQKQYCKRKKRGGNYKTEG